MNLRDGSNLELTGQLSNFFIEDLSVLTRLST